MDICKNQSSFFVSNFNVEQDHFIYFGTNILFESPFIPQKPYVRFSTESVFPENEAVKINNQGYLYVYKLKSPINNILHICNTDYNECLKTLKNFLSYNKVPQNKPDDFYNLCMSKKYNGVFLAKLKQIILCRTNILSFLEIAQIFQCRKVGNNIIKQLEKDFKSEPIEPENPHLYTLSQKEKKLIEKLIDKYSLQFILKDIENKVDSNILNLFPYTGKECLNTDVPKNYVCIIDTNTLIPEILVENKFLINNRLVIGSPEILIRYIRNNCESWEDVLNILEKNNQKHSLKDSESNIFNVLGNVIEVVSDDNRLSLNTTNWPEGIRYIPNFIEEKTTIDELIKQINVSNFIEQPKLKILQASYTNNIPSYLLCLFDNIKSNLNISLQFPSEVLITKILPGKGINIKHFESSNFNKETILLSLQSLFIMKFFDKDNFNNYFDVPLVQGSLLVMDKNFKQNWKRSIDDNKIESYTSKFDNEVISTTWLRNTIIFIMFR